MDVGLADWYHVLMVNVLQSELFLLISESICHAMLFLQTGLSKLICCFQVKISAKDVCPDG